MATPVDFNLIKAYLPRTLLVQDDKPDSKRHAHLRSSSFETHMPGSEAEFARLVKKADARLAHAPRDKLSIVDSLDATFRELESSIVSTELKSLFTAYSKSPSKLAIRFETWGGHTKRSKPGEYAREARHHIIYTPGNPTDKPAYGPDNTLVHELGHFVDATLTENPYAHSQSLLFIKAFDADKKLYPKGMASQADAITVDADYTDEHTPQDVINRENFANALMRYAADKSSFVADYPESPLVNYFQQIIEKQLDELSTNRHPQKILEHLHEQLVTLGKDPRTAPELNAAIDTTAQRTFQFQASQPTWIDKIAELFPYTPGGPGSHHISM